MKTFNISKEQTDFMQRVWAIVGHYSIVKEMAEKELTNYIVGVVFKDIGLEAEDFQYCNVDIVNGKIEFDEDKKKESLGKEKKNAKDNS